MKVLQSFRAPTDQDNPYIRQLVTALSSRVDILFFSWGTALFGKYDVFHTHWPEFLLQDARRSKYTQYFLLMLLVLRLSITKLPIVRTMHNIEPHEDAGRIEKFLLKQLDRRTRAWIRLNEVTSERSPYTATILHGHYRDWFSDRNVPATIRGRLVYFGLIRPYKGVESLLDAFQEINSQQSPELVLRIVGYPKNDTLRIQIEKACRADHRIQALLAYVDDATTAREIGEAELVVLPYRQMHNSGSLLLALSLCRPVLVPRNQANEVLAAEVGPGWVYLYDAELNGPLLQSVIERLRQEKRSARPDLSRREWADAGEQHVHAYVTAQRGGSVST